MNRLEDGVFLSFSLVLCLFLQYSPLDRRTAKKPLLGLHRIRACHHATPVFDLTKSALPTLTYLDITLLASSYAVSQSISVTLAS